MFGVYFALLYPLRVFLPRRILLPLSFAALSAAGLAMPAQAKKAFPPAPRGSVHRVKPPAPSYTPPPAYSRQAAPSYTPAYTPPRYAARAPSQPRYAAASRPRLYGVRRAAPFAPAAPLLINPHATPLNGGGLPYRIFRYANSSGSLTEPLNSGRYAGAEPLFHPDERAQERLRAPRKYAIYHKRRKPRRPVAVKVKKEEPLKEAPPRRSLRSEAEKYRYHDVP